MTQRLARSSAFVFASLLATTLAAGAFTAACGADDAPPGGAAPAAESTTTTTASGLQYEILVPGKEGKHAKRGDRVKVHYTGTLTDGKVFDDSRKRGMPAEFTVGQVIEGWNEALALMTVGARWKLTIPSKLGYGVNGAPPAIPPNATLVFDVELLGLESMPDFTKPDPEKQTKTESGLKYEIVTEGSGEPAGESDAVELKYALWNTEGALLQCSEQTRSNLKCARTEMPLPFMKEAVGLMKPASRWRFEVPAALGFGAQSPGPQLPANSVTIWELELVRVIKALPVPAFVLPDDAKLTKTESGLKYEMIEPGEGKPPAITDTVKVHYAGWLTDGTLFDSSFSRGEEIEFPLRGVIKGWGEGLQLMKPGATYRFVIPANLAYGPGGQPPKIPANATLVFYVKLVSVAGR